MKINVLLLGVLKYKDKQTGVDKYRVSYLLNDSNAFQNTSNFIGINELSFYTDCPLLFETVSHDDILQPAVFEIIEKPNPSNPLKMRMDIASVKLKNGTISLL